MRVVNFPDLEDEVVAKHGPEPVFDPVNNQRDAFVSETINRLGPEVENLQQRVFEAETQKEYHNHPLLLGGILVFMILAEFASAFMILESMGVGQPELTAMAATLAMFILFMTEAGADADAGGEE